MQEQQQAPQPEQAQRDHKDHRDRERQEERRQKLHEILDRGNRAKALISDQFLVGCLQEAVAQWNNRILELSPDKTDDFAHHMAARNAILGFARGLEEMVAAGEAAAKELAGETVANHGGLL